MNAHHQSQTVPHNTEAEQALLGAILVNKDAFYLVSDFLLPEHFYEAIHGEIFTVLKNLVEAGKEANPVTAKDFLAHVEKIGDLTIGQYLMRLLSEATTVRNAQNFGDAIYSAWARRQIISVCEDLSGQAYMPVAGVEPGEIIDRGTSELNQIDTRNRKQVKGTSRSIAEELLEETSKAYQRQTIDGIPLPLPELETLNHGPLEAGNLYGLLGGTKEGKSSLTAQIMREAISNGHPVLCLSYDQTGVQWLRQFIAQSLGIDANDQRRGKITTAQFEEMTAYAQDMAHMPFKVIKCSREGADRLTAYAARFVQETRRIDKPVLVVADHVGKITPYDTRADAGTKAGAVNQAIKAFAGDHNVAWLSLIQRNSDGGRRLNPRPAKRDVYGGEAAVADYDAIFYVYRAEKWLNDQLRSADPTRTSEIDRLNRDIEKEKGKAELGLIAHRFAPEHITRDVRFIAKYTRYESLVEQSGMGW